MPASQRLHDDDATDSFPSVIENHSIITDLSKDDPHDSVCPVPSLPSKKKTMEKMSSFLKEKTSSLPLGFVGLAGLFGTAACVMNHSASLAAVLGSVPLEVLTFVAVAGFLLSVVAATTALFTSCAYGPSCLWNTQKKQGEHLQQPALKVV